MTDDPQGRAPRQQPARTDAEPPCTVCIWRTDCTAPRRCKPFALYVQTGREVRPPMEMPGDDASY